MHDHICIRHVCSPSAPGSRPERGDELSDSVLRKRGDELPYLRRSPLSSSEATAHDRADNQRAVSPITSSSCYPLFTTIPSFLIVALQAYRASGSLVRRPDDCVQQVPVGQRHRIEAFAERAITKSISYLFVICDTFGTCLSFRLKIHSEPN